MENIIIAIDQGTTSSRTLVFSLTGETLFVAQEEFPQLYPKDGWVEHNPEDMCHAGLVAVPMAARFACDCTSRSGSSKESPETQP